MLTGILRVVDDRQMDRMHEAILTVLEKTGLQIRGRFLLEALADAGCKVDFDNHRAWFKPELVERQVGAQRGRYKMVRSSLWYPHCREMPEHDVAWPDEFAVDFGHGTPWILDHRQGYRQPTRQDQIDAIRLGNALEAVKAINAPFICGEFDPRMETIESSRLLLLNTRKPGWVGTSSSREVKYLADFADLATDHNKELFETQPPIFVHAYCTTSPLKIDERSCSVCEAALPYKFPVNFAPMPILGATTPITAAGSVVVAAAEILGGITAVSLIDPDVYYFSTSISAEMDMRTTQVCYSTPAAILTDAALHQLFRYKYGIVHCVEPAYAEGKTPGLQSTFMKIYRQMALGCTASLSLPIGLLDNASVFSPAQAMIDLDLNRALYGFAEGIEVNDDTLCVDLIDKLEFCQSGTYLEAEHTLRHFRDVLWDSKFLDRTYGGIQPGHVGNGDNKVLDKADEAWRDLVARQEPLEVGPEFAVELDRIVEAAKKELLR